MPSKSSAAARSKKTSKTSKAKVVQNRPGQGGPLGFLRGKLGMLSIVLAFVLVGAGTLAWAQAATTTTSLWSSSNVPKVITDSDSQSVELGVKFKAKYSGEVLGVRFYKGPQNTGTHTGTLWSSDGRKLASVTFKNETKSGWQSASFANPVAISANTTYIVSYFAPKGRYSVNTGYFKKGAYENDTLTALRDGAERGNGVYTYASTSTFPKDSYQSSNYWVDVVFSTKRFSPTPKPLAPANLAATVSGNSATLKWKDSATTGIAYYEIYRDDQVVGKNQTGAGYTDGNLTYNKTYTYKVRAIDAAGQASDFSNSVKVSIAAEPKQEPAPTPAPTPNPTPTPAPTPGASTSCPLPKYPTPTCAGVRAGVTLQDASGMTITTPGQVIEGKHVKGSIDIRAHDVVIRNSQIDGVVINDNTSTRYRFTIEDSTVGPASGCSSFGNGAIGVSNYTARRLHVRGFPDAFRVAGPNILIEDSYATLCSGNPNDHSDGIQAYGAAGGTNITIRHNTIDQRSVTNGAATAPIFLPSGSNQGNDGATINIVDNVLAGGGFTLRAYGLNFPSITGNKIVDKSWAYGPLDITCSSIGTWGGNAVVTYDWTAGQIISQVRALNDCN